MIHLDFETYSEADIRKVGHWRYARDPSTEVICLAWAEGDGPVNVWRPGLEEPSWFRQPADLVAHNAGFEYAILKYVLGLDAGIHVWSDTAAMAAALSLPRSLDGATRALGMPEEFLKDKGGSLLIQQLCQPRRRNGELVEARPFANAKNAAKLAALLDYCKQDVVAERELGRRLMPLPPFEQRVWWQDLLRSECGAPVDVPACQHAIALAERATALGDARLDEVTHHAVPAASATAALRQWVADRLGRPVPSMDKAALRALLTEPLPDDVREALEIRQRLGKSSVAKYSKIIETQWEGRVSGLQMYYGAHTGRWAGRLVQIQNLPRGSVGDTAACIDFWAHTPRPGGDLLDEIEFAWGDPLEVLSSCIRGMFVASEGQELHVADYTAIEAVVAGWVTDHPRLLNVFRTHGKLYESTASALFNMPLEAVGKKSIERQVAKVADLACQYQGGRGAFATMAATYALDLEALASRASADQREDMAAAVFAVGERTGERLTPGEAFSQMIVNRWRAKNGQIVRYWRALEDAAKQAIRTGVLVGLPRGECEVKFKVVRGCLFIRLPSGRSLKYHAARLERGERYGNEVIGFMGLDDKGNWGARQTYGGKLFENVVQAIARDLLAHAELEAEAVGYESLFSVHDELVAQAPIGADLPPLTEVMCRLPEWAGAMPVRAAGFVSKRYRKD